MSLNHTHLPDRHQNQCTSKIRPKTYQNKSICPGLVSRVCDCMRKMFFSPMENFNDFRENFCSRLLVRERLYKGGSSTLYQDHCNKRIFTQLMHTMCIAVLYPTYILWGAGPIFYGAFLFYLQLYVKIEILLINLI